MAKLGALIETLFLFALAAIMAWLGVSIPVHFRATSRDVLKAAAEETVSLEDLADIYADAGQVGPVRMFWEASDALPRAEGDRERVRMLLAEHPAYWLSGGPSPYFEQFLEVAEVQIEPGDSRGVAALLLPRDHRQALLGFLRQSSNQSVQCLLEARELTTFTVFPLVGSPAGHALDSVLLTNALLVQANAFQPEFRVQVGRLCQGALQGDRQATEQLESFLIGMLSLSKRLDWTSLAELVGLMENLDAFAGVAGLVQASPDLLPTYFSASLLSEQPEGMVQYLEEHPDEGMEAIEFSLGLGRGALQELFERNQLLYQPPLIVRWMDLPFGWLREPYIAGFALTMPILSLIAKSVLFFISGFSLGRALLRSLELLGMRERRNLWAPLNFTSNVILAILIGLGLWAIVEPSLMQFGEKEGAQLRLQFDPSYSLQSLKSQNITPAMIDQVTIIVLIIFFVLQLMIYILGLIKMHDVRRMKQDATKKLVLLENEESLFDLGLYVGLGGTVVSLIMLAMDIVQASLIAAYASTLFGIIFVAILKVFHVRPFRRKLILDSTGGSSQD